MTFEAAPASLPTFTTDRLRIRPLDRTDVEAIFVIKSDPAVTEQYGREPSKTIDETRKWLEERMAEREQRISMYWVFELKEQGRVVGSCCLWNSEWDSHRTEIGYELSSAYWRKGIMSEGIPPILYYGFGDLMLNRIEAGPVSDNIASNKLLLKLGFKYEGNMRQRFLFRGKYLDQAWYGMLKEEWDARQRS